MSTRVRCLCVAKPCRKTVLVLHVPSQRLQIHHFARTRRTLRLTSSILEPLLASEQHAMCTHCPHSCCKRLIDAIEFLSPPRVRPHIPLVPSTACGDPNLVRCRHCFPRLVEYRFAFSGISRQARASQNSTESGITSTALERRMCASVGGTNRVSAPGGAGLSVG